MVLQIRPTKLIILIQDILEGTELGQQEELSTVMNIMNQQQTQSSVSLGAVQGQTGAVTGLLEG